ncbi:FeoB-associated Cys-rich membrane protein [Fulvivirga lutea]|uniref:FeoB-associated Cys-rich membrane protein n=1 Tax=Fulvivirga lutea TaxID=2810512 RepID=A0A974WKA7_9BACT|nr:FeoB-associated Cys-rich membrane protein [Fulvivirga lutea]
MIEGVIIGLLFVGAIAYVGRGVYKTYKSEDSGCSKNCDC